MGGMLLPRFEPDRSKVLTAFDLRLRNERENEVKRGRLRKEGRKKNQKGQTSEQRGQI